MTMPDVVTFSVLLRLSTDFDFWSYNGIHILVSYTLHQNLRSYTIPSRFFLDCAKSPTLTGIVQLTSTSRSISSATPDSKLSH